MQEYIPFFLTLSCFAGKPFRYSINRNYFLFYLTPYRKDKHSMTTLYYGEIVAKISGYLHQNPDNIKRIDLAMRDNTQQETIHTLCADAGKVFDQMEELCSDHFIDWHKAQSEIARSSFIRKPTLYSRYGFYGGSEHRSGSLRFQKL